MFLAIDIGNSRIKCGLFAGEALSETFEMEADPTASVAAYRHSMRGRLAEHTPTGAGISSVVPAITDIVVDAVRSEFMILPTVIGPDTNTAFSVDYHPRSSLGADRLCAAAAAQRKYGLDNNGMDRALIVVDAGTAINYEVVAEGVYRGGAIAPGPVTAASALSSGTGRLPEVDPVVPGQATGNNTNDALRAGIMFGLIDAVAGMVTRLVSEIDGTPLVLATGGYGELLAEHVPAIDLFDPFLVLEGIRILSAPA